EDLLSSRSISGSLGLRQDCRCRRANRRCERQSRNDATHRLVHDHLQSLSRCEEINNLRHGYLLKVLLGAGITAFNVGAMRHIAAKRWFSVTSAFPLLRTRRAGMAANLLVIRSHGRNLLVAELLGDGGHQVRAVLAKTALPHMQRERGILCVLSGKVRHWRHALAVRPM